MKPISSEIPPLVPVTVAPFTSNWNPEISELLERASLEGLVNVHFLPYQPEEQFAQIVRESDACFVTLHPGLDSYSAPSRAYTFLSAGTAVITIMPNDSELAKLITSEKCGWNASNSDRLIPLLENLLENRGEYIVRGNRAQQFYLDHYQESIIMNRYLKVIQDQMYNIAPNIWTLNTKDH